MADGEAVSLGRRRLRWFDTPHFPHCREAAVAVEETEGVPFAGDLFTQPGADPVPVTTSEDAILGPSEALRSKMAYYSNPAAARIHLDRLAAASPRVVSSMHGAPTAGADGISSRRWREL